MVKYVNKSISRRHVEDPDLSGVVWGGEGELKSHPYPIMWHMHDYAFR